MGKRLTATFMVALLTVLVCLAFPKGAWAEDAFGNVSVTDIPEQIWTGSAINPPVVVSDGEHVLIEDSDYTLAYFDNTDVGRAQVLVQGKYLSPYQQLSKTVYFNIVPLGDLERAVVPDIPAQLYTGDLLMPKPTSVMLDGRELVEGQDYIIVYSGNVEGGHQSAQMTLTGINGYIGQLTKAFDIAYAVSYDLAGGALAGDAAMSYLPGTSISLPFPTRVGYSFAGWIEQGAQDSSPVWDIDADSRGNKHYVASWAANVYNISYVLNGGTNVSKNPRSYKITSSTIVLSAPTRSKHAFAGWYSDSACTKKVTQIPKGSTGNKRFYAKWNAISYKITYHLNGGKNSPANSIGYKTGTAVTLSSPTRAGYTFKGWFAESTFKTRVKKIGATAKGNKRLYAKWAVTNYSNVSYSNGRPANISLMTQRYKNHKTGGIAVCGTSYMSAWDAEITFDSLGYDAGKVYNFAIGGDSPIALASDAAYISMVAAKKPHVVVFNGANDLWKERQDSSVSLSKVDDSVNAVSTFVANMRTALKKKGVDNPKFIISGAMKTPAKYAISVGTSNFTASRGPKTCVLWDRVDLFNAKLKEFAAASSDVTYFNLEPYFYKVVDGTVRYYRNAQEHASGKPTGVVTKALKQKGYTLDYLGTVADSKKNGPHHPTKKAHREIFPALAKKAMALA